MGLPLNNLEQKPTIPLYEQQTKPTNYEKIIGQKSLNYKMKGQF